MMTGSLGTDDHDRNVETTKVDVDSLSTNSCQSGHLPWSNDQYTLPLGALGYHNQLSSVVVNNAVHWLVKKSMNENQIHVLLAFDLACIAMYREVAVPPSFLDSLKFADLKVLGGYLSLWRSKPSNGLELRIMKEY
ncbi:hypothetical protein Droror1_Dr00010581 [Drosera rotundifolia]